MGFTALDDVANMEVGYVAHDPHVKGRAPPIVGPHTRALPHNQNIQTVLVKAVDHPLASGATVIIVSMNCSPIRAWQ